MQQWSGVHCDYLEAQESVGPPVATEWTDEVVVHALIMSNGADYDSRITGEELDVGEVESTVDREQTSELRRVISAQPVSKQELYIPVSATRRMREMMIVRERTFESPPESLL